MTLAAVVVAYPEQLAKRSHTKRRGISKIASVVANLLFTCLGVGSNVLAVGYGPVAIVTPISVGASLLSNMALQSVLGIAHFTKNAIVGTLILVASVTMLPEVGPADVQADVPVLELLSSASSVFFILATLLVMGASVCAIARGWVEDNITLVFLYAILGASDAVLNTALTKIIQMDVPPLVRIPLLVLYVFFALIGIFNGAQANSALDDPALFVPIGAAANLLLTCLAGIFIWGDGSRLASPLAYAMVYTIIALGSYVLSEDDILGLTHFKVGQAHVDKLSGAPYSSYENADLHPKRARGRFAEEHDLHNTEKWKDDLKSVLSAGEDTVDEVIAICEEALMRFSPNILQSTAFHKWLRDRMKLSTKERDHDFEATREPLLEWRSSGRRPCKCVIS
eukprot:TRINITY_DN9892_c0_g1_i2.p1 TRINITY_DN9892_c0_g1~~TRINITY_DN9892_c0_g1_i2.p1  ORF type:complete len:430 (+),score=52.76 TRINITY_DN9892_c0_g1_i2:104-1291(+)